MEKIIKTWNEIKEQLVKAMKIPGMPSLKAPALPKTPSMAPSSNKDPVKVAEQINTPQMKDLAMKRAVDVKQSKTNQMAFKSEDPQEGIKPYQPTHEGEPHFHIMKDGQRLTTDPVPLSTINNKWGGVKSVEGSGHILVPVKKERLTFSKNGQWKLD